MSRVWTPLRKAPHPNSVHWLSDDACVVLAALRDKHKKAAELGARHFEQVKGSTHYYDNIYRDSFKTESTDVKSRHTSSNYGLDETSQVEDGIKTHIDKRIDISHGFIDSIHHKNLPSPVLAKTVEQLHDVAQTEESAGELIVSGANRSSRNVNEPRAIRHSHFSTGTHSHSSLQYEIPSSGIGDALDSNHQRIVSPRYREYLSKNDDPSTRQMISRDIPLQTKNPCCVPTDKESNSSKRGREHPSFETRARLLIKTGNSEDGEQQIHTHSSLPSTIDTRASGYDTVSQDNRRYTVSQDNSRCSYQSLSAHDLHVSYPESKDTIFISHQSEEATMNDKYRVSTGYSGSDMKLTADHKTQKQASMDTNVGLKRKLVSLFSNSDSVEKSNKKSFSTSHATPEQISRGGSASGGQPSWQRSISWKCVTDMTSSELASWQQHLYTADIALMTMIYNDGSSQLRELQELNSKRRVGCTDENDGKASFILVSILVNSLSECSSYPVTFPLSNAGLQCSSDKAKTVLLNLLDSKITKVCFYAQELMHAVLDHYHLIPERGYPSWKVFDPKVASWLLNPDNPPITFSELLDKHLDGRYMMAAAVGRVTNEIHLSDLVLLDPVMRDLSRRLREEELWDLFRSIEVKLTPILSAMEVQGIKVSGDTLHAYGGILQRHVAKAEFRCHRAAGHPFQINSHVQLRQVLFEELRLDQQCHGQKLARTNVQNLKSTSEAVLHKLRGIHPLPELVLNFRQLVKMKSTYIDGIVDYITGQGYIHTNWEQTTASSGRLQSANPNIQNIPRQQVDLEEESLEEQTCSTGHNATTLRMREPFVSHDGWTFVAADFQSMELRLLAHLSKDQVLLNIFNQNCAGDIFVQLTCEWLGVNETKVSVSERDRTKRIVYSVIYGVGPGRLAETLGVSKEDAKVFTKSFLGKFKGIHSFTNRCIADCQRHGFVRTISRRWRHIKNINSQNFHARSHAERQAVNFVVQGSAADICKLAMINTVHELNRKAHLRARLLVQIHDELLFEVHDEDLCEVKDLLKSVMEATAESCGPTIKLLVPLPVSLSTGKTWGRLQAA